MTARSLAELALKVWGVVMVVGALTALPANLALISAASNTGPQEALFRTSEIVSSATLVFHAFVGMALVVWCDRIVSWIVPTGPSLPMAIRVDEARTLAFAVIGLSTFINGVQNAAVVAYTLYSKPSIESQTWSFLWSRQRDSLVKAVVQVVAGFLLLGGREWVGTLWTRLRSESIDDIDDSESGEDATGQTEGHDARRV
jgi:hypothetical protein